MISLRNISKKFNGRAVVRNLSLEAQAGEKIACGQTLGEQSWEVGIGDLVQSRSYLRRDQVADKDCLAARFQQLQHPPKMASSQRLQVCRKVWMLFCRKHGQRTDQLT